MHTVLLLLLLLLLLLRLRLLMRLLMLLPSIALPIFSPSVTDWAVLSSCASLRAHSQVGELLKVQGLTKHPDLNGRIARVVAHDPSKGTWSVFIEGESKRFALKPDNLKQLPAGMALTSHIGPSPTKKKTTRSKTSRAQYTHGEASPDLALDQQQQASASGWLGWGGSPNGDSGSTNGGGDLSYSPSAGGGRRGGGVLSQRSREEARSRLYAPSTSYPPRPKAAVTERAKELSPFESTSSPDGVPEAIEDRPPFQVPMGKRRTHASPERKLKLQTSAAKTTRVQARTFRGTPTTWAVKNRTTWEGRTTSPTGRSHPNRDRRNDVRKADLHQSITYYATQRTERVATTGDPVFAAVDNDRKMKEASFVTSQAWFESLRHYPKGKDAIDDEAAYSGLTHGGEIPGEHLETDVRAGVVHHARAC